MPKTNKSSKQVCEFCTFGTEVRVCGRLWHSSQSGLTVTAHHKCMDWTVCSCYYDTPGVMGQYRISRPSGDTAVSGSQEFDFSQYSAGLVQYKNEFTDFGNFDPKEVKKEVKRGNKLKCHICKNRHGSATAGCALNICPHSFHFLCAKQDPNRTTLVKKINVYQGEGEGVLDEYVIFCKVSHKHAFDKKRDEAYKYVDSSDDEAAPWNRYGYGYPYPSVGKKGASSKKKSPPQEIPGKTKQRKSKSPEAQGSPNTSKRKSPTISDEDMRNDPKLTGENELKIVLKKCNVENLKTSVSLDDLAALQGRSEMDTSENDAPSKKSSESDVKPSDAPDRKSPKPSEETKDKSEDKKDSNDPGSSCDPVSAPPESTEDRDKKHQSETNEEDEENILKTPKKRSSPEDRDSPSQVIKMQKLSSPVTPKQQKPKGYRRHPFFAQTDGHMDPKSPLSSPQAQAANSLLAPLKQVVQKVWQSMQIDTPAKNFDMAPPGTHPSMLNSNPKPYSPDVGKMGAIGHAGPISTGPVGTVGPVGAIGPVGPVPVSKTNKLPPLSECVANPAASQRVIGTLMKESDNQPLVEVGTEESIAPCIKQEPDTSPAPTPAPTPYMDDSSSFGETQMPVKNVSSPVVDCQSSQFTQTIKNEPDEQVLRDEISLGSNGFNATPSRSKESAMSTNPEIPITPLSQSRLNQAPAVPQICPTSQAPLLPHSYKPHGAPPPPTVRPNIKTSHASQWGGVLKSSAPSPMVPAPSAPIPAAPSPMTPLASSPVVSTSMGSSVAPPAPMAPAPVPSTMAVAPNSMAPTPTTPMTLAPLAPTSAPGLPVPRPVAPSAPAAMSLAPSAPMVPLAPISQDPNLQQQANIIDPSDIRIASITPVSKSPQRSNQSLLEMPSPPTRGQSHSPETFSPQKANLAKNSNGFSSSKLYHPNQPVTKSLESPVASPQKPLVSSPASFEQKKSELTERLHGIMSGSPCKDGNQMVPPHKKLPSHVTNQTPTTSPKPTPKHASTRSDAVLCMVNLNRIDRSTLDFIYTSALTMFGVKRHQVLMKYMPPSKETNSKRVKFDGLLHLKELAESLSNKDLQCAQKLALDKNMHVYDEKHKTFSFDMYPTLLDIVKAILQESDLKYNYSIAKMLRLQKDDNAVAFMLHLNENTDPGFKVRAVYNNIFIWNPNTQVNFEQEMCDPEREYATIQSWLDKQITQGICPFYKPSDSILLRPNDQSVIKRLKEKILELTFDQPQPPENARKVYFIGPMDENVIPSASSYLKKCIPRITEQLDSQCSLVLCVIAIDRSIRSIKDVCAPLPGFDMNILTVFDPSEFCPSCFVLKIARRKKAV